MVWNLRVGGKTVAWVVVSDDTIEWLRPRLRDPRTRAIDPYCGISLDAALVEAWWIDLRQVVEQLSSTAREEATRGGRLPKDAPTRARIVDAIAQRELLRLPHWKELEDAIGLLELARESGGVIDASGD